jgi:hypothetical protein
MAKPKRPRDMNQLANMVGKIATGEIQDTAPTNPRAAKRGEARAAKLTPARRKEIAQKAAKARWSKR